MPNQIAPAHGVMEGQGAYRRYAKLPAGGAALAVAVRRVELNANDPAVVIAEYRCTAREKLDDPGLTWMMSSAAGRLARLGKAGSNG